MKIIETPFKGLVVVEPKVHPDSRGHFFESYNRKTFKQFDLPTDFVQINQSSSVKNVIRGLHFQKNPHAQSKLVRVLVGTIRDVVVDLRHDQPTFRKAFSIELSMKNQMHLFVPRGFAHGISVLSDVAEVLYHSDEYYHPELEAGILFNDPVLNIDWGVDEALHIVSDKDLTLPRLGPDTYTF